MFSRKKEEEIKEIENKKMNMEELNLEFQEYFLSEGKHLIDEVSKAMAGEQEARKTVTEFIKTYLENSKIEVEGRSTEEVSKEMFSYLWGLDILQEEYDDESVNEIRVNGPDHIYVLRHLEPERINKKFKDNEHISKIIYRLISHDKGVGLNKSLPTIESMRRDGTRITATCPDITKNFTLVLRKHTRKIITPEQMIERGNLDKETAKVLDILVAGRANILIAGGVGSGKTTLLRTLFTRTGEKERTVVLESDRELLLSDYFSERDIIEMEEHPENNRTLEYLFNVILRYSPTRIFLGEFRGKGEARSAIEACLRGHDGSMTTGHFPTYRDAIDGTARLLLSEGMNVTPEIASATVAKAFNIIIQMFGDMTRGIIKLVGVTEVYTKNNRVVYNEIIRWVPKVNNFKEGKWEKVGYISDHLVEKLKKYGITEEELLERELIENKNTKN